MPIRFTSPSLGGQRDAFLRKGEWEAGVSFRRLYADQWFVGTDVNESAAPFGKPLYLDIRSLDFTVAYGFSRSTSLMLTVPTSTGTHSRFYADGVRHVVSTTGIGDVNSMLTHWLLEPDLHIDGNVAVGLGVKLPIGGNTHKDRYFAADGSVSRRVVDQSIQPGDGGVGFIIQSQAYKVLRPSLSVYAFGSYLISARKENEVPSPLPGVSLSVPDVYSGRIGLAAALPARTRMSLNLGGRVDGIPLRDVVGGGDDGFRRPGHTLYLDPGFAMKFRRDEFTVSVPVRVRQNFSRSLIDRSIGFKGGGDLADYLIFAGYSRRF